VSVNSPSLSSSVVVPLPAVEPDAVRSILLDQPGIMPLGFGTLLFFAGELGEGPHWVIELVKMSNQVTWKPPKSLSALVKTCSRTDSYSGFGLQSASG
jgi:hypothetical protein